jgi:hypothetical protein
MTNLTLANADIVDYFFNKNRARWSTQMSTNRYSELDALAIAKECFDALP